MAGHEMASIYASAHPSNGQQTGIWLRSLAFMLKAFVWNRFSFGDFEVGMKWPRKNGVAWLEGTYAITEGSSQVLMAHVEWATRV